MVGYLSHFENSRPSHSSQLRMQSIIRITSLCTVCIDLDVIGRDGSSDSSRPIEFDTAIECFYFGISTLASLTGLKSVFWMSDAFWISVIIWNRSSLKRFNIKRVSFMIEVSFGTHYKWSYIIIIVSPNCTDYLKTVVGLVWRERQITAWKHRITLTMRVRLENFVYRIVSSFVTHLFVVLFIEPSETFALDRHYRCGTNTMQKISKLKSFALCWLATGIMYRSGEIRQ